MTEFVIVLNLMFGLTAIGISSFSLWRTRVRGAEINIPEVWISGATRFDPETNQSKTTDWNDPNNWKNIKDFSLKPLVQNIGDRMTFLRFNEVYVVNGLEKYPQYNNTKWEWTPQPETQAHTTLRFTIPAESEFNLGGLLVIHGDYTHHTNGFQKFEREIPIKF